MVNHKLKPGSIGLQLLNFGRLRVKNYVPAQNMVSRAALPPSWREAAEAPLVWKDVESPSLPPAFEQETQPQVPAQQPARISQPAEAPPQETTKDRPTPPRLLKILQAHQGRQPQSPPPSGVTPQKPTVQRKPMERPPRSRVEEIKPQRPALPEPTDSSPLLPEPEFQSNDFEDFPADVQEEPPVSVEHMPEMPPVFDKGWDDFEDTVVDEPTPDTDTPLSVQDTHDVQQSPGAIQRQVDPPAHQPPRPEKSEPVQPRKINVPEQRTVKPKRIQRQSDEPQTPQNHDEQPPPPESRRVEPESIQPKRDDAPVSPPPVARSQQPDPIHRQADTLPQVEHQQDRIQPEMPMYEDDFSTDMQAYEQPQDYEIGYDAGEMPVDNFALDYPAEFDTPDHPIQPKTAEPPVNIDTPEITQEPRERPRRRPNTERPKPTLYEHPVPSSKSLFESTDFTLPLLDEEAGVQTEQVGRETSDDTIFDDVPFDETPHEQIPDNSRVQPEPATSKKDHDTVQRYTETPLVDHSPSAPPDKASSQPPGEETVALPPMREVPLFDEDSPEEFLEDEVDMAIRRAEQPAQSPPSPPQHTARRRPVQNDDLLRAITQEDTVMPAESEMHDLAPMEAPVYETPVQERSQDNTVQRAMDQPEPPHADLLRLLDLPPDTPIEGMPEQRVTTVNRGIERPQQRVQRQEIPLDEALLGLSDREQRQPPQQSDSIQRSLVNPVMGTSMSPIIESVAGISEGVGGEEDSEVGEESDGKNENVERLARDVYRKLRQRLRIEQERRNKR